MSLRTLLFFLAFGYLGAAVAATADPNTCNLNDFAKIGYFDFRDNSRMALQRRQLVEGAHFTASVRRGVSGNTGKLIDDLDYVLRHIPNHPQALMVMYNVQTRPGFKRNKPGRTDYYYDSIGCYFKKALAVAPDDPAIYLARAIAAHRKGEKKLAEQDYLHALSLHQDYAEAHYNFGLLLFSQKKFQDAQEHADKAYELGYPLEGLRRKLASRSK